MIAGPGSYDCPRAKQERAKKMPDTKTPVGMVHEDSEISEADNRVRDTQLQAVGPCQRGFVSIL